MGSEDDEDDRPDLMEGKDMKKDKETMKEDMHITTDSRGSRNVDANFKDGWTKTCRCKDDGHGT